jgi:molybdopterin-guanine dinucleotide biosynthesis protein B
MKIVFVVGTKNSGKTTVSEFLVRSLSERGLSVATIKHIHHEFTIDTEGKDTFRMRKAGAKLVVSFSPSEIAILRPPGDVEEEFRELSGEMEAEGFDYLVVEGFKVMSGGVPSIFRILTCKTTAELDALIPAMLPNIDCISGVVSATMGRSEYLGLPVIAYPAQGEELVRRVLA